MLETILALCSDFSDMVLMLLMRNSVWLVLLPDHRGYKEALDGINVANMLSVESIHRWGQIECWNSVRHCVDRYTHGGILVIAATRPSASRYGGLRRLEDRQGRLAPGKPPPRGSAKDNIICCLIACNLHSRELDISSD